MGRVLGSQQRFCTMGRAEVEDYYRGVFSAGDYSVGEAPAGVLGLMPGPGAGDEELLTGEVAPGEVMGRLARTANTALGWMACHIMPLKRWTLVVLCWRRCLAAVWLRPGCLKHGKYPTRSSYTKKVTQIAWTIGDH